MRQHWRRLDALAGWRPRDSGQPNPDLLKPRVSAVSNHWIPLAAAAAALAALVVLGIGMSFRPQRVPAANLPAAPAVETATVGPRRLDDGTIIELNRGADVQVHFTPAERRIRLVRGEAHFSVKRDAARQFIVEVGGIAVRAVGTAFNIRFAPTEVEVLVTEGSVEVEPDDAADLSPASAAVGREASPLAADRGLTPLIPSLAARQRAVISLTAEPRAPQIATLTAGEIDRVLSWQDRMLDFTAAPLDEVIAKFNRRNVVQLVLVDAGLASIRISGTFRSDNLDGFVHLLEAGFGARAEKHGDEIVLRKAK